MTAPTAEQTPDVTGHFQKLMGHLLGCEQGCSRLQYCDTGRQLRRALRDAKSAARTSAAGADR
ncbi:hypothetical protein [Streptomyces fagopyri]|uniref:hypothetical protein n=1 Tax=Streptomyces fagopyri TaxID=2662397 RepID=UPI003811E2A5